MLSCSESFAADCFRLLSIMLLWNVSNKCVCDFFANYHFYMCSFFRKTRKERRRSSLGRGRISIGLPTDLNASGVEGVNSNSFMFHSIIVCIILYIQWHCFTFHPLYLLDMWYAIISVYFGDIHIAHFSLCVMSVRREHWIQLLARWVGGLVVRSRTSDSEVAGSSPIRTAFE